MIRFLLCLMMAGMAYAQQTPFSWGYPTGGSGGSSATPCTSGGEGAVQYNTGGLLDCEAAFNYDASTNFLSVVGTVSTSTVSSTYINGQYVSSSIGTLTGLTAGTISTTGMVSNSSTYSNYMREGILAVNATTATTVLNLGVATMISSSITSNTTVSTSNVNYLQANITVWKVCQDGTGGRTITWPDNARFNANTSPTITTTADTCSTFTLSPLPGSNNILVTMPATGFSN